MHKFDKIKTAADKRLALDKRGKAAPVDFKVGDSVVLSEKLDGFNTSLDTNGKTYSRSNEAKTRFVMLDEQKYEIASGLDSLSDFPDFKL